MSVGFITLLYKEILRFWKVKGQTLLGPLVNAALYLLVFGVTFSSMLQMHEGFNYLEFLVPGLVALGALNNSLQNSASSVMVSKFHGDLQDLKLIPLSATLITAAYSVAAIVRGFLVALLVLILGEIFSFFESGHGISVRHPAEFVLFLSMGCAVFGNFGIWIGFISKTFDQINVFMNFIVLPLIYLGGVFFSLTSLHPFWQRIAEFNPLVYMINGIRWSVLGVSDVSPLICFMVLIVFVGTSSVLAWYSVSRGSYQRF